MSSFDYDVVVAGGGPAGASTAALLARQGRKVALFEKEHFPRFHLGESLLPMSMEVLEELGVADEFDSRFMPKYGARFLRGEGEEAVFRFEENFGLPYRKAYHGPRADIDLLLLDHARRSGVEVREGVVVRDTRLRDGNAAGGRWIKVEAGAASHEVSARVFVDATGRDALCGHASGCIDKIPELERNICIFAHFEGCSRLAGKEEGDIRIVLLNEGWLWFIPFVGGLTSVGLVTRPEMLSRHAHGVDLQGTLEKLTGSSPPCRAILADARAVTPCRAVADFSYHVRAKAGDACVCVGDAAGFVDPLFSTGFHLAVKGGSLAARAIGNGLDEGRLTRADLEPYEALIERAIGTFTGVVQAFYRGELAPLLFSSGQHVALRKMMTSVLAGDVFHLDPPRWLREIQSRYPPRRPLYTA